MERKETQPDRSRDTDALRAACGREGCPICAVMLDHMQGVMDSWQYEDFTDVEHRHEVIRTRGFCPLHTWQLAQLHTPFQLAVIYREVLTDVLAALERDQENMQDTSPRAALALPGWLKGQHAHSDHGYAKPDFEQCYFCRMRDGIEQRLIDSLVDMLRSEQDRVLISQSTGLCLTHFTQAHAYAEARYPEELRLLLDCEHACLARVLGEVQELVRKHDYRFKDEPRGDEMTSWRRGAELCAGNPGVR